MKKININKKQKVILLIVLLVILIGLGLIKTNVWRIKMVGEYKRIGEKAQNENNLSLAVLNYKKALTLSPLNKEIAIKLGDIYVLAGESEKAINYYEKVRDSYGILNKIGDLYYRMEEFEQANKNYQKSTNLKSNSYAYARIGECSLKTGDIDKAKDNFEKALEVEPLFYKARFYLSLVLAFKNPEEAERESKVLDKNDQLENDLKKAISNINSGDILYGKTILANLFNNLEFPKSAILVIEPEIKENTSYRDAFLVLANIYFQLKDYDKAITNANKAVEIDPIYIPSFELLSQVYREKGDSKKSQEYLDKISALKIKS